MAARLYFAAAAAFFFFVVVYLFSVVAVCIFFCFSVRIRGKRTKKERNGR